MRHFLLIIALLLTSLPAFAAEKESAFDRVIRTQTIRCSYLVYPPYFMKDANSGALSGVSHDIMEQIGKNANLKIEWTEEVGYDNIFSGLDTNRYDVFAGGLWPNASRAKAAYFSIPAFYSVILPWGRAGESRFGNTSAVNKADIRIAVIDGAMEDIIARTDFPAAQRISLPTNAPFVQNFENIVANKADITFAEPGSAGKFIENNPGKLKQLSDKPLRIFGNSLVSPRGDNELKQLLDAGMNELVQSGQIDQILALYKTGNAFMPVARPYGDGI